MALRQYKIVYCTPALYMAGGVERVLTLKANYFAEHFGYDITIILTEGKDKPLFVERVLTLKANYFAEHFGYDITIILTEGKDKPLFYPLSDKVKVINLDIGFEELWTCSFLKKVLIYLKKQHRFRKALTQELMRLRPDITISLLRREINFITSIKDGSKKIGELHVNRANYRNFESAESNVIKNLFSKFWMKNLVQHLRRLDGFVTLTKEDLLQWPELKNVVVIPDPLAFYPTSKSPLESKRVIAVGRYAYQKGFDLLLRAWEKVEKQTSDWELVIFGQGDRSPYDSLIDELHIDRQRCHLNGPTENIISEYLNSSVFVFSSRFEGFGMVLVEAMACGLPVVSFDCPCGPKDIVASGVDGILVENGNIDRLSEAVVSLIQDEKKLRRMACNAIDNVQRFNIEQVAQRWKSLFESV